MTKLIELEGRLNSLEKKLGNLAYTKKLCKLERDEKQLEIDLIWKMIIAAIKAGETTGNLLTDFVIIRYGSLVPGHLRNYRSFRNKLKSNVGKPALLVNAIERLRYVDHSDPEATPDDNDYALRVNLCLGVIGKESFQILVPEGHSYVKFEKGASFKYEHEFHASGSNGPNGCDFLYMGDDAYKLIFEAKVAHISDEMDIGKFLNKTMTAKSSLTRKMISNDRRSGRQVELLVGEEEITEWLFRPTTHENYLPVMINMFKKVGKFLYSEEIADIIEDKRLEILKSLYSLKAENEYGVRAEERLVGITDEERVTAVCSKTSNLFNRIRSEALKIKWELPAYRLENDPILLRLIKELQ